MSGHGHANIWTWRPLPILLKIAMQGAWLHCIALLCMYPQVRFPVLQCCTLKKLAFQCATLLSWSGAYESTCTVWWFSDNFFFCLLCWSLETTTTTTTKRFAHTTVYYYRLRKNFKVMTRWLQCLHSLLVVFSCSNAWDSLPLTTLTYRTQALQQYGVHTNGLVRVVSYYDLCY